MMWAVGALLNRHLSEIVDVFHFSINASGVKAIGT